VFGANFAIEQSRGYMIVPVAKYIRFHRYNIAHDPFRRKASAIDLRLYTCYDDPAPALRGLWKLLHI